MRIFNKRRGALDDAQIRRERRKGFDQVRQVSNVAGSLWVEKLTDAIVGS